MYDENFSKIYDKYGWDYFSLTMGQAILDFFKYNKISINTHIDLCCGTGTLCDYFYKQNIKSKGIDISESMVSIAKSKNKNIEFICENVLHYKDKEKYDLVTLTCDAINHFIGEDDLTSLFKNISALIKENGYLILDILDSSKIEFNNEIICCRDNDIKVHFYITPKGDLINTNVKVKQNNKLIFETDVIEKMYNLEYIKGLLEINGLEIIKAENKILDEKQRVNDKIYVICKKI